MSHGSANMPKHAPQITQNLNGVNMGIWVRVVGCTCGWRTPPGPLDSDTAFAWHVAIANVGEQP